MTNHIVYFKKPDDFWALWLIIFDFFSKCNSTGVFNQSEIGNEHAANCQNKMYIKFPKI